MATAIYTNTLELSCKIPKAKITKQIEATKSADNSCKTCCYKPDTNKSNVLNKNGHILMLHKPNLTLSVVTSPS